MTNVGYHIRNGWLQKPPLGAKLNWAHPLTKGLVGCWLFNEGGGNKAYDLSGYNNHGTLNAMAFPSTTLSGWNPGKDGVGLQFDGSSDYVDCGNDPSLNITNAITIEAWVKTTQTTRGQITAKVSAWQFAKRESTHKISIYLYGITPLRWEGGDTEINDGVWHHIVATYDANGGANNGNFYLDGVLDGQFTSTGNIDVNSNNLAIGNQIFCAHNFNGAIDEVRIYNRALNAEEIKQLYIAPYAMFEPATKYTIIDERLRTKHVGSNIAAAQMLRERPV